jgi:hypothetical protein
MQTEANFAQAGQDLILRVAQAYFDVLFAIENLRAVQANKTAIAQQLEQAKKNFEVGTATITDTYESQSRFDLATAQEIAADNELEVKRYALRVLIGKDPGELNRLKPKRSWNHRNRQAWSNGWRPPNATALSSRPSRRLPKRRPRRSRSTVPVTTRRSMWSPTTARTTARASLASARSTRRPPDRSAAQHPDFSGRRGQLADPRSEPPGATPNGPALDNVRPQLGAQRAPVLPRRGQWPGRGARAGSGAGVESQLAGIEPARLRGRRAHQHRRPQRRESGLRDPPRSGRARFDTLLSNSS